MEHEIRDIEDMAEGSLRQVELGGNTLLLARVAGRCHAVGATCPHAGGPLAEGVLHGEVVVCPWHKAAFRVTDGKRVEPPALDDLPVFPLRTEGGRTLVERADSPARAEVTAGDARCFVIVGAGAAGESAAQTLRAEGFAGRVVMVSREERLPYDRTVLSKYALSGKQSGEKSPLQDAAFYDRRRIERLAREVDRIDAATRRIIFADGGTLAYDAALVATGGVPRPLDVPGADLPGVSLLRTPDDAARIATAAAAARAAVVVGGGFIAVEAASLRERGLDVTVVVPQGEPFERQLGAEVGAVVRRFHEKQGVRFRLGAEVARIDGDERVRAVVLSDGTRLPADFVVAGLGVAPATALVQGVARRDDGGLPTDARLRVADGLFAAGDVAAFPLRGDGPLVRVEHWRVAQQHGRVAALNMLGRDVAFDAVPYFWTIHFMQRLDYVGHAERWDEVVVEGDIEAPSFLATYVADGRVAALAGWGRDRQMATAIHLMTEQAGWTQPELAEALRRWAG